MVATAGMVLIQLPPDIASFNVTVPPVQTLVGPVMAAGTEGRGFTVTDWVADIVPQLKTTE